MFVLSYSLWGRYCEDAFEARTFRDNHVDSGWMLLMDVI